MSDDVVDGTVGREADGVVVGKGNTQQSNRAGDINLSGQSNEYAVWFKLLEMADQIRALVRDMDDLPNRVRRLEDVEVIVKASEVVIRPRAQDVNSLTDRMLLIILIVMLVAVLVVVATFIFWVISNA
jgi:hypothetical protein